MRKRIEICLLMLALLLCGVPGMAQVAPSLAGRVVDATGGGVANVKIALTQVATGLKQTTSSTESGDYLFLNLVPGSYRIEASAPGYSRLVRSGITAVTGTTVTVELALKVGAESESVTVEADAALMQVATSNIQTNISAGTVASMPLNSRNFIQLAVQSPGVELPPGTVLPRINGGRPRTNEYLLDGISLLQPEPGQVAFFPNLDAIQEFTVETNNVPAEFGRFNGGVINVASKSGSASFHGSAFEYLRNEAFNARNYFATTGSKPVFRRNLFGGALGGPIVPGKLFFFVDYQGNRQLIGVTSTSTIPTTNMRNGIFTGVSKVYDPAQVTMSGTNYVRKEFANDVIDPTRFDAVAKALLARFPTPTNTASANNYVRTGNDDLHEDAFDVRIDGVHGAKDRFFGRYTYYQNSETPVTPLPDGSGVVSTSVLGTGGVAGLADIRGQQMVLDATHTFSPRLVNDLRLGYTRRSNNILGTTLASSPSTALGIPGIPTNASFNNALPLFTIAGLQQIGPSASTFTNYQTGVWELIDQLMYTRGRHQIKVGGDIRWYQLNAVAPPNPTGAFAFTTTGTNTQSASSATASGGNAFASFLLGQVDNFQIDLQSSLMQPRVHIEEYYAQDDWKVTSKLTANFGVRWTLHFPSIEKNDQGAVFNLATQQLDYAGVNGNSRSARRLHWANFAPRVGLAYQLTPKTVVRSGYGMVFIDQSGITTPFTLPQYPFIQNVQQKTTDSINKAFVLSSGPTVSSISKNATAGLGQSVYTVNRSAGSGYSQQWNVAVQRELTPNLSVEVAYVGSHIVHLGMPDTNLNQLTAAQLADGALVASGAKSGTALTAKVANPCYGTVPTWSAIGSKTVAYAQTIKPYPCYQNVATYRQNTGTSVYHGGQVKVTKRFSRGNSMMFGYTRSKLIDDASSVFSTTVLSSPNSSSLSGADTFNPRLERDLSSGDMPNVLSMSGTYQLPMGRGHRFAQTGLLNAVLGGWATNAMWQWQSGMPVTVKQTTNNNSSFGYVLQRPNKVGDPKLANDQQTPAHWFNTSAFSAVSTYVIGNATRNPVRGPGYHNLDFALTKSTRVWNETSVEFRAEIFNLSNTPQFGQPNGTVGAAAFGTITTTTTDPRVVQFALRFSR